MLLATEYASEFVSNAVWDVFWHALFFWDGYEAETTYAMCTIDNMEVPC